MNLVSNTLARNLASFISLTVMSSPVFSKDGILTFDVSVLADAKWPKVSEGILTNASECPKIHGVFELEGEAIVVDRESTQEIKLYREPAPPIYFFTTGPKWSEIDGKLGQEQKSLINSVEIARDTDGVFLFRSFRSGSQVRLMTAKVVPGVDGYSCVSGRLRFAGAVDGYSDGARNRIQIQRLIVLLVDGSILYFNSMYSTTRSFFIFSGSRAVATYSRYKLVEQSKK